MAANFKDHFSHGSANYAAHRPTYPMALVDFLAGLCPARGHALDCGCGTGQLSVLLAERFDQVTATDASVSQIRQAQAREGVTYRTAEAGDSGLPDGCVDLVTVAQAAHWLDLDVFYKEVRRVAKPDAVIALITYGVMHIDDRRPTKSSSTFTTTLSGPGGRRSAALLRQVTAASLSLSAGCRHPLWPSKFNGILLTCLATWRLGRRWGWRGTLQPAQTSRSFRLTLPRRGAIRKPAGG
ncbi:MAG: putative methyltransferase [Verrucomicrobiales bacterium]|nr:putative methyltransferase [Verrucomicrobiales bacterium]